MPVKPENRHFYRGAAWKRLRAQVLARAGNCCEGTPMHPDCRAANGEPHPVTGSRVVLTIMHLDQNPGNNDLLNVRAACQRCHNSWDAPHRARNAAATRATRKGANIPMSVQQAQPGDIVHWGDVWRGEKQGEVIALVPRDIDASIYLPAGAKLPSNTLYRAKVARYLVRVDRTGAKGQPLPPKYMAPALGMVRRVDKKLVTP